MHARFSNDNPFSAQHSLLHFQISISFHRAILVKAMPLQRCLCIIVIAVYAVVAHCTSFRVSAPSVFRADETEFHKYAAVLAATAPFKAVCNQQIKQSVGPLRQLLFKLSGKFL